MIYSKHVVTLGLMCTAAVDTRSNAQNALVVPANGQSELPAPGHVLFIREHCSHFGVRLHSTGGAEHRHFCLQGCLCAAWLPIQQP